MAAGALAILGYIAWTICQIWLFTGVPPARILLVRPSWMSLRFWSHLSANELFLFLDEPFLQVQGRFMQWDEWVYSLSMHRLAEIGTYALALALFLTVGREVLRQRAAARASGSGGKAAAAGGLLMGLPAVASLATGSVAMGGCCGVALPLFGIWLGAGAGAMGSAAAGMADPWDPLGHALWAAGVAAMAASSYYYALRLQAADRAPPRAALGWEVAATAGDGRATRR